MLSSGWRGTISNFAIYLDVPIPADWHTKPGLNVACGLSFPLLGPFASIWVALSAISRLICDRQQPRRRSKCLW
jgi:hypothetical protein